MDILTKKVSKKKFLALVGISALAIPFLSKAVFARILLRKTDLSILDLDKKAMGTTKGDLIVYDGSEEVVLGVGADTNVLTADSAEASGIKWAAGGSGGVTTFVALDDTPAAYTAEAGKYAKVNATEDGLEFDTPAGAGDVVGPASSTDNAVAIFDGATGKLLQESVNADIVAYLGRAVIGDASYADCATFGHYDQIAGGVGYALLQNDVGATGLNCSAGQSISFLIANVAKMTMDSAGEFGIGIATPDARLEVETGATEGKQAVTIDQNDTDKAFIDFQGTTAIGQSNSISTAQGDGAVDGPKKTGCSSGWDFEGMVMVEINGSVMWIPYYSIDVVC